MEDQVWDKDEKAAHSSITKWLKDLTSGSSNQSYDIGPHILVDDLNEPKGKFRLKSESFKNCRILHEVTLRESDLEPKDDIYENVESINKRTRRKYESFKEIKSKCTATDNIYENVQDKRKFKRHSFSGTKNRDRHSRKYLELEQIGVDVKDFNDDDSSCQRIRYGKKKKERNKTVGEQSVRKIKQVDNYERDNYANHVSEYEVYVNESAAWQDELKLVENEYEVIDVPKDKFSKRRSKQVGNAFLDKNGCSKQVNHTFPDKQTREDRSCKRYEKNTNGNSMKILNRHCVLYHSQNRGHRPSRRNRLQATLRRHSFNLTVPETVAGSTKIR
ncbi:hypothetical protein M8J77_020983 [Diaphorina citri]|nr:hypothetical protein M8J77_020983 [Diaphorina citri]